MNTIHKFQTESFITALKAFFQDLKVPVNYISDYPTSAKQILTTTYKESETFQLIKDVYSLGIIDDDAFEGFKSIDTDKIKSDYDGILLFGIELNQREKDLLPSRSQLADIARAFNREFCYTPVVIIFKYGNYIAFANTERMQYKQEWREGEKVGKVTLLRDIDIANIHSGHLRILQNLEVSRSGKNAVNDFKSLYKYWQDVLSVSILNKVFYKELSNWYFWAINEVRFPNEPLQIDFDSLEKYDEALKEHKGKNVIRLLTRLLFIWFIKEKGLIPEEIFDEKEIASRFIDGFTPEKPEGIFADGKYSSKYYRGILQNLFFATLNQPRRERQFRSDGKHLNATQLMRYRSYLKEPDYFVELMESKVPFMNGGLFECLDKPHPTLKGTHGGDRIIYVDGFSDRSDNEVVVPDFLFFDKDEELDLSKEYGSAKSKKEKTRGLFNILKSYKFTITENTPIDEDVALDPELLGKVFENLLASYNPETKTTARKQTGSFYTPREIVNYMVEESLIAYLKNELSSSVEMEEHQLSDVLQELVSFSSVNPFEGNATIQKHIIKALDSCKILDPACGSGAYPMGILQKMVHILHKIDPNNTEWKHRQIERVNEAIEKLEEINDPEYRNKTIKELKNQIEDIEAAFANNELDYGRKLFLIENCIYGVDIQPIATQISKLRFFISLVVDQKVDESEDNFGIRPLPNLETKFVAANTLIGLPKQQAQISLFDKREVKKLEDELKKVRHKLFSVKTPSIKRELRAKDKELREKLQLALSQEIGNESAQILAQWDPYDQNTSSSFFDKTWMFDMKDGFDIVIGNPPYIGHKGGLKTVFRELKKTQLGKLFNNERMDIFYYFFHASLDFTNCNGVISFITTNYYLTADSAIKLRKDIRARAKIFKILNFNELKVFESAMGQHNIVTFLTKNQSENQCKVINISRQSSADLALLNQILNNEDNKTTYYSIKSDDLFDGEKNYIRLNYGNISTINSNDKILDKIKNNKKSLINYSYISQGIVSGIDKVSKKHILNNPEYKENKDCGVFVLTNSEVNRLGESKLLKPWYKNSDIKRYLVNNIPVKWLIHSSVEINISQYENINNHLSFYKKLILNRNYDSGELSKAKRLNRWWALSSSRWSFNFDEPKIVSPQRSYTNTFAYTDKSWYASADVYFISEKLSSMPLLFLLGILNSKLIYFWLYNRGKRKGEMLELYLTPLSEIPIPEISNISPKFFISIINQILDGKKSNLETIELEHQIDVMVYHLYELSYEEAFVIDNGLSMEDFERFRIN